jgi:hypothetical protein
VAEHGPWTQVYCDPIEGGGAELNGATSIHERDLRRLSCESNECIKFFCTPCVEPLLFRAIKTECDRIDRQTGSPLSHERASRKISGEKVITHLKCGRPSIHRDNLEWAAPHWDCGRLKLWDVPRGASTKEVRWEKWERAEERGEIRQCARRTNHEISSGLTYLNGECLPIATIKSQLASKAKGQLSVRGGDLRAVLPTCRRIKQKRPCESVLADTP